MEIMAKFKSVRLFSTSVLYQLVSTTCMKQNCTV